MQETRVRFLGQEDTLEKEMATLSSILAWESYSSWGHQELDMTEQQLNRGVMSALAGVTEINSGVRQFVV